MGKKKQNSVTAVSKAKKDFKQRMATANVSSPNGKVNSKISKFKSTKPVLKNLKKMVNETRGRVSTTNEDFDKLQSQIYGGPKQQQTDAKMATTTTTTTKRDSFEKLIPSGRDGVSEKDVDAALAQFSNFYPLAARK